MWVIPVVYFMFMNAVQGQPLLAAWRRTLACRRRRRRRNQINTVFFFITARLHHHTSSDAPSTESSSSDSLPSLAVNRASASSLNSSIARFNSAIFWFKLFLFPPTLFPLVFLIASKTTPTPTWWGSRLRRNDYARRRPDLLLLLPKKIPRRLYRRRPTNRPRLSFLSRCVCSAAARRGTRAPRTRPADEHAPDEPAFSFPFVLVHVCRAHYRRRNIISPPPPPRRRRRQSLFSSSHERSHNQSARGRHCGV